MDLEGWTNSKKEVAIPQVIAQGQDNPHPVEEDEIKEAEDSLSDRDMKRKCKDPPSMRKSKRRRLEKLTGWGENSIHLEEDSSPQEDLSSRQEEVSIHQEELTSL